MSAPENNITALQTNKKHLAFLISDDLVTESMINRIERKGGETSIYYTIKSLEASLTQNTKHLDALIVDMDYFDLAKLSCIPSIANTRRPKIFALSSKNDMDTRLKAVQSNVQSFIMKPLNANELTQHISAFFGLNKHIIHDILIVDDDSMTLKFCQKFLEAENIRLRFVNNPKDILHELEHYNPDLILLDYYMPYANGLDINRVIRQIYSISEIPILFMTGSKDHDVLTNIRKESGLDPILKPIHREDLVGRVFEAMQ